MTVRESVTLTGHGIHSGSPCTLTIHPAAVGEGVRFLRTDLKTRKAPVRAEWRAVTGTDLCTVIGDPREGGVSTPEHLLAALAGLGVDNALVELDGPEVPILDGSALPFVEALAAAGLDELDAPRRHLRVLRTVEVELNGAHARLDPSPSGFHLDVGIDFPDVAIGRQGATLTLAPGPFRREVASCRTFGFLRDVERLWAAGFALGASMENTVVLAEGRVANVEGLRHPHEFARHKLLDAIGDLSLAGLPLVGAYRSRRGGHAVNAAILRALLSDRANYAVSEPARPDRSSPARRAARVR